MSTPQYTELNYLAHNCGSFESLFAALRLDKPEPTKSRVSRRLAMMEEDARHAAAVMAQFDLFTKLPSDSAHFSCLLRKAQPRVHQLIPCAIYLQA